VSDSLWTFLFELANFAAFAALLGWLFFKPVRSALADQQAKTRQVEQEAARKLAEAESLQQKIEAQHQSLGGELEAMRRKAHEAAEQEAEQIRAEARHQAEQERAAVKREALHIERAQLTRLAEILATATQQTVGRFLGQLDGPSIEQTLLQAACRELKSFDNRPLPPIVVESAQPLHEEQRQILNSALGEAAESAEYRVSPRLKGGLRISTAQGLIDASLEGLASFAQQSLSAELKSVMREEADRE
jgi:F0F1-type ATP synthase membrane subunit b/b'